jgi:hypothetical protein
MVFNWKQYLDNYPDLVSAGINSEKAAKTHYRFHGKSEGRTCLLLPSFDNSIISGEKIQLSCDYFIGSKDDINYNPHIKLEINKNLSKWLTIEDKIISDKILKIFCYTHIDFKKLVCILNNIQSKFILYFHNSDAPFLQEHYDCLCNITNLVKIYAQNNTCKEVITLPIGQANTMWKHGNYKILSMNNIIKTKEIFLNFNITTDKRKGVREILNFIPWIENKEYSDYIHTLSTYKYCICIEGNGLDTHRFWECIYLKVIPICLKNKWTDVIKDIYPIIIIDNWIDLKNNDLIPYDSIIWDNYKHIIDINNYIINLNKCT